MTTNPNEPTASPASEAWINDLAVRITEHAVMELDADEENTAQIEAFVRAVEREIAALVSPASEDVVKHMALREISELDGEINPVNYDHNDASYLNRQFCRAVLMARKALSGGSEG